MRNPFQSGLRAAFNIHYFIIVIPDIIVTPERPRIFIIVTSDLIFLGARHTRAASTHFFEGHHTVERVAAARSTAGAGRDKARELIRSGGNDTCISEQNIGDSKQHKAVGVGELRASGKGNLQGKQM